MSDISTVAEAMGIPADLVSRSASARAEISGSTTEEVLEAWAGGAPVASTPPDPEASPESDATEPVAEAAPEPDTDSMPTAPVSAPDLGGGVPVPPVGVTAARPRDDKPPVLVGARDNPMTFVAASAVLFLAVVMLALVGPSIPTDAPGARTSQIAFTEAGLAGQDIYLSLGCASCHTQMVRPIVADVGIGPVTLSDTNQVLGTRRFGPDLANVGNRITAAQIESILRGGAGHPGHSLSATDMSELVAYLVESAPEGGAGE